MRVGFTGTIRGMTERQEIVVREILRSLVKFLGEGEESLLIHGGCKGADAQADRIGFNIGYAIEIHPSNMPSKRMPIFCGLEQRERTSVLRPERPLPRNHTIVDRCHVLVAAPRGIEVQRSGTWATVRYARHVKRKVIVVGPDGTKKGM